MFVLYGMVPDKLASISLRSPPDIFPVENRSQWSWCRCRAIHDIRHRPDAAFDCPSSLGGRIDRLTGDRHMRGGGGEERG